MVDYVKYLKDEYNDYISYKRLAEKERNSDRKRILEELASTEYQHYLFWRRYVTKDVHGASTIKVKLLILMRLFLGLTFTVKLLERHEAKTISSYKELAQKLVGEERTRLEKIIQEELEHEKALLAQIDEAVVRYLGFVALGLADAIIEITGVHAGFLGVTSSTFIAGIAGLVVGFAAAISMASAAYLQVKHGGSRHPIGSALVTGIAYLFTVTVLALPYFLITDIMIAFALSITLAIVTMAIFTFYGAVVSEKMFLKEFVVSLALIMGTALAAYIFGDFLGTLFGIKNYLLLRG